VRIVEIGVGSGGVVLACREVGVGNWFHPGHLVEKTLLSIMPTHGTNAARQPPDIRRPRWMILEPPPSIEVDNTLVTLVDAAMAPPLPITNDFATFRELAIFCRVLRSRLRLIRALQVQWWRHWAVDTNS